MLSKIYSTALFSLKTTFIEVEVEVFKGLHAFSIIGLPEVSIKESKQRVSAEQ